MEVLTLANRFLPLTFNGIAPESLEVTSYLLSDPWEKRFIFKVFFSNKDWWSVTWKLKDTAHSCFNPCDTQLRLYHYFHHSYIKVSWTLSNPKILIASADPQSIHSGLRASSDVTLGVRVQLSCCLPANALAAWIPASTSPGLRSMDLSVWDADCWLISSQVHYHWAHSLNWSRGRVDRSYFGENEK